jgi:ubiquinol-cytochrome c reductase cytochrome b subunit
MLQVVISGAHLPPREVNWWLGLALLGCVLGLSLTGYLLPWDQKGYWATQVATNIMGNVPMIGPWLQKIVVGGPVYGHHTLTRFFALHVAIFPPLIVVLLIAHVAVFRRHGVTAPANAEGEGWFWPDQAFRDMLAGLVVFAVMLGLVIYGHGHPVRVAAVPGDSVQAAADDDASWWSRAAHAGRAGRGANLDAPADPERPYPARPEWYFLFLFQLLKYFPGESEIVGTVVIPGLAGFILLLLPLLGYGPMRRFGYWAGVTIIVFTLTSIAVLTVLAIAADRADTSEASELREQQAVAEHLAKRAVQLATAGIPADGPVNLLRRDPLTRGSVRFGENCGGCHRLRGPFETGDKASDLSGYGTEERIIRLIMNPGHNDFFGRTGLKRMAEWAEENLADADQETKDEIAAIAEWLAAHPRKTSRQRGEEFYQKGIAAFQTFGCNDCHTHEEVPAGTGIVSGPNLTGYGDDAYLRAMIMAPDHPSRYGLRNRMPAFRDLLGPTAEITQQEYERIRASILDRISADDPDADTKRQRVHHATQLAHLSDIDRELIIRFLLNDHRVVFGGEPISGPPK